MVVETHKLVQEKRTIGPQGNLGSNRAFANPRASCCRFPRLRLRLCEELLPISAPSALEPRQDELELRASPSCASRPAGRRRPKEEPVV